MTTDLLLWVLLVLLALNLALCVWLAVRRAPVDAQELVHRERVLDQLQQQGQQTGQRLERVESELLRECLALPLVPSWRRTLERRLEKGLVEDWTPRLQGRSAAE